MSRSCYLGSQWENFKLFGFTCLVHLGEYDFLDLVIEEERLLLLEAHGSLGFFDCGWPRAVLGGVVARCRSLLVCIFGAFLTGLWLLFLISGYASPTKEKREREHREALAAVCIACTMMLLLFAIPYKILRLLLVSWAGRGTQGPTQAPEAASLVGQKSAQTV